jgi:hypothetical protein
LASADFNDYDWTDGLANSIKEVVIGPAIAKFHNTLLSNSLRPILAVYKAAFWFHPGRFDVALTVEVLSFIYLLLQSQNPRWPWTQNLVYWLNLNKNWTQSGPLVAKSETKFF